jgi:Fe-S-cluster containining protein
VIIYILCDSSAAQSPSRDLTATQGRPLEKGSDDFSFSIETPDGIIPHMYVRIPRQPIGLSDCVPFMQTLSDELIGLAVRKSANQGAVVSCGPGCGVCCCQLIPLSAPEVFFIVKRLLAMPLAERGPILLRFETIENHIKGTGLLGRLQSLRETNEKSDNRAIAVEYFGLEEPCPFLVSQSCSIHAWRPVVCREFNALSDPSLCRDPFVNTVRTVPLFKRPSSVLALLASRVAGISSSLVPLPQLFDWYEANKELDRQTWDAGMLIRKMLEITVEKNVWAP